MTLKEIQLHMYRCSLRPSPEIHKVPLWSQLTPANLFTISWRTQDICDSHSFKFQWKNWHRPYILLGMEKRTAILHVEFSNVCQSMMNLQPARLTLRWSAKKEGFILKNMNGTVISNASISYTDFFGIKRYNSNRNFPLKTSITKGELVCKFEESTGLPSIQDV